jgi:hypothetical protein
MPRVRAVAGSSSSSNNTLPCADGVMGGQGDEGHALGILRMDGVGGDFGDVLGRGVRGHGPGRCQCLPGPGAAMVCSHSVCVRVWCRVCRDVTR